MDGADWHACLVASGAIANHMPVSRRKYGLTQGEAVDVTWCFRKEVVGLGAGACGYVSIENCTRLERSCVSTPTRSMGILVIHTDIPDRKILEQLHS